MAKSPNDIEMGQVNPFYGLPCTIISSWLTCFNMHLTLSSHFAKRVSIVDWMGVSDESNCGTTDFHDILRGMHTCIVTTAKLRTIQSFLGDLLKIL